MKRTVFCTFDHRDLADISIGKLRAAVSRIDSISYIHGNDQAVDTDQITAIAGVPGFSGFSDMAASVGDGFMMPPIIAYHQNTGGGDATKPPRPVTVKIVCDEDVQQKVVSKLVNLRAYRIVAT